MPRTIRSISAPARDARYSASMTFGSDEAVHLHDDAAPPAGLRDGGLLVDQLDDPVPQHRRRQDDLAERGLPAVAGEEVEQVAEIGAEIGVGGEEAEVLVGEGGVRVVVAGADVHVATDAVGLLAHDERRLRMGLQADEPVDDVDAHLLERPRPRHVGLLVEPGLQLDEHGHLLAPLGGPDQRLDDRAVGRGAIQRLLDRQHVAVEPRPGG